MKYIYGFKNGKPLQRIAKVYSKNEHAIRLEKIDRKVIQTIRTLHRAGYEAYIVGGAIRDFLIGKNPKDFDLVTNALPRQIRKLFHRAKIIGKRFTIVLIPITRYDYIEISTFRSSQFDKNNDFGSISEDVLRRDFTCNSLYYCIQRQEIIDFVNGVSHIKEKKLVPVYKEYSKDPVRMLRAVKFSVQTGLRLSLLNKLIIFFNRKKLVTVSFSRKTEEFSKIIVSPKSAEIIASCFRCRLLKHMLPNLHCWFREKKERLTFYLRDAARAKYKDNYSKQALRRVGLLSLLAHFISEQKQKSKRTIPLQHYVSLVKDWLYPLGLPNIELKMSIRSILSSLSKKKPSKL